MAGEFDCIRQDVEAVAALAQYYSNRIRSVTHLEFYRRTFHHPELQSAYDSLQKALSAWDRLSTITEGHFGYVPEPIRMGVAKFRWRDEGRSLGVDLDQINNLEAEFQRKCENWWDATIGHVPPRAAQPGQALQLVATSIGGGKVVLWYRNSRQSAYTPLSMLPLNPTEHTWSAEIPQQEVVAGRLDTTSSRAVSCSMVPAWRSLLPFR